MALLKDAQNRLWVGTYDNGLDVLDKNNKKIAHYSTGNKPGQITATAVFAVMQDRHSDIWVGMDDGGINVIHNGLVSERYKYDIHNTVHSLTNNDIRSIYQDKEGNIWVGTFDGLNLYNALQHTFSHFKVYNSGLTNNTISEIFEDNQGNLWVGTLGGGLNVYNKKTKRFSAFSLADQSIYSMIGSIIEDKNIFLWVSTGNGLIRFKPGTDYFRHFTTLNGLQATEFSHGSGLLAKNGELLFGGMNGFNIIDPGNLPENSFAPQIVFSGFQLFNKNIPIGNNSVLKK